MNKLEILLLNKKLNNTQITLHFQKFFDDADEVRELIEKTYHTIASKYPEVMKEYEVLLINELWQLSGDFEKAKQMPDDAQITINAGDFIKTCAVIAQVMSAEESSNKKEKEEIERLLCTLALDIYYKYVPK